MVVLSGRSSRTSQEYDAAGQLTSRSCLFTGASVLPIPPVPIARSHGARRTVGEVAERWRTTAHCTGPRAHPQVSCCTRPCSFLRSDVCSCAVVVTSFFRPDIVFLDEATSALDVASEAACMALLHGAGITVVSVGHRPSLVPLHATVVDVAQWAVQR